MIDQCTIQKKKKKSVQLNKRSTLIPRG